MSHTALDKASASHPCGAATTSQPFSFIGVFDDRFRKPAQVARKS